jgi:gliding motility-associated-like protein
MRYFYIKDQVQSHDQGMVLVGKAGAPEDSADLVVMKLDEFGSVVWNKIYPSTGRLENMAITEMSDGTIVVASDLWYATATTSGSDILTMKIDCQGNVLWSNKLSLDPALGRKYLTSGGLKEGKNGDIILSLFAHQQGSNPSSTICRLNNTGGLVWNKTFYGVNSDYYYAIEAFYKNNKIVVMGHEKYVGNFITPVKRLFSMILNYDNGNIEKEQAYNLTEFVAGQTVLFTQAKIHFDAEQLIDNTYALFGIFAGSTQQTFYYYKLIVNEDLSIKQSQAYSTSTSIGQKFSKITVFRNGQTHITGPQYESATYYAYAADKNGTLLRQKKTPYTGSILFNGDRVFQMGSDNYGYFTSHFLVFNYQVDIAQVRNGDNNISSCMGIDTAFITPLPWQSSNTTWSWASTRDNQVVSNPYPFSPADLPVTVTDICAPVRPVKTFTITGSDNICTATSTPFSYQVKTSKKENKPVQWRMDAAAYQSLVTVNDSTVSIVFNNPTTGPYKVKLYAYGGTCQPVQDSLEISVYPASRLPRFVNICTNNIQVDPGNWFKSYRWQDGSTNPVYTITQPGRYIVELTTHCNEVITDTVDAFGDRTGLLNRERTICENDTLLLQAPAGFINYRWEPDYRIEHVSNEVARVYPDKNTFYVLFSETTDGCQLKDTVDIKVKAKPRVSLGNDTTVCTEGELTLKTGTGFAKYLWSTGESTAAITITQPGIYSIAVTDAGGCKASDTITITAKVCPRRIRIPTGFSPNGDRVNDIFKAVVQGQLESFELMIYNRWGGVVFRSTNPQSGWDGTIKGIQQHSGTYVWMCRYKFRNEATQIEKGTLQLIK